MQKEQSVKVKITNTINGQVITHGLVNRPIYEMLVKRYGNQPNLKIEVEQPKL